MQATRFIPDFAGTSVVKEVDIIACWLNLLRVFVNAWSHWIHAEFNISLTSPSRLR